MNAALLEPPGAKLSSTPSSLQLQGLRGCWLAHLRIVQNPACQRPTRPSNFFRDTILLLVRLRKHYYLKAIYYLKVSFFFIVPELTCSHATPRYRLVTGSLDFFVFSLLFYREQPPVRVSLPGRARCRNSLVLHPQWLRDQRLGESPSPTPLQPWEGGGPWERTLLLSSLPECGTSLAPYLISGILASETCPGGSF